MQIVKLVNDFHPLKINSYGVFRLGSLEVKLEVGPWEIKWFIKKRVLSIEREGEKWDK